MALQQIGVQPGAADSGHDRLRTMETAVEAMKVGASD